MMGAATIETFLIGYRLPEQKKYPKKIMQPIINIKLPPIPKIAAGRGDIDEKMVPSRISASLVFVLSFFMVFDGIIDSKSELYLIFPCNSAVFSGIL